MLDIAPRENVSSIINSYTIAPNVWFDLDLEHNGSAVSATKFNSYVAQYATLRKQKGFSGPGVFAFYDFRSFITPISSVRWQNGSVTVVPIFDGYGGKSVKWSATRAHYSRFSAASFVGIMEFITRWGSRYDSGFAPRDYYLTYKPSFFIAQ